MKTWDNSLSVNDNHFSRFRDEKNPRFSAHWFTMKGFCNCLNSLWASAIISFYSPILTQQSRLFSGSFHFWLDDLIQVILLFYLKMQDKHKSSKDTKKSESRPVHVKFG